MQNKVRLSANFAARATVQLSAKLLVARILRSSDTFFSRVNSSNSRIPKTMFEAQNMNSKAQSLQVWYETMEKTLCNMKTLNLKPITQNHEPNSKIKLKS